MLRAAHLIAIALPLAVLAQNSGSLSGSVLDSKSGKPIGGAEVTLNYNEYKTTTGKDGSFQFTNLPFRTYYASLRADGYQNLKSSYASIFSLIKGAQPSKLVLRLEPDAASISGKVRSLSGNGIPSQVELIDIEDGRRIADVKTDSGSFSLTGIPPGRYRLCAAEDHRLNTQSFSQACHPNATRSDWATQFVIEPGMQLTGKDVILPPIRMQTILGRFAGVCPPGFQCHVHHSFRGLTSGGSYSPPKLSRSGSFTLRVPPGMVSISVEASRKGSINERAVLGRKTLEVRMHSLYGDVEIPAIPGFPLLAKFKLPAGIVFEKDVGLVLRPPKFKGEHYSHWLKPTETSPVEFIHVAPGKYSIFLATLPADLYVARILSGGQDVTDSGIEIKDAAPPPLTIELANGTASISGRVMPWKDGSQCYVRAERLSATESLGALYNRFGTCSLDGQFTIDKIAPGKYKVFATAADKSESGALVISLAPGETKRVNLAAKNSFGQ